MFGSRATGAFVCLRCELQRPRSCLPTLVRRATHATFSTSARRLDALNDEVAKSTPQRQPLRQPHQSTRHPPKRQRKNKAKHRETIARLEGGVKTLGDDAAILVLREVEEPLSEESHTPEVIPAAPTDAMNINIAESLQLEKQPVSPSEVIQRIDSMRPPSNSDPDPNEPHYVSQTTYVKLSQRLLHEFSSQQLSQYYSIAKGVQPKEVDKQVMEGLKKLQSQAKRPEERSEWHPGTTQINLRLPGLAVPKRVQKKPVSKHLLVDQILRDIWRLVLLEEIEAPGELELSLKPWQLTLLTSGNDMTPLDQIGQDRRVKIEIHWPHNVLRITADKSTAEYAADDIENLLQNTETHRFHLQPWVPYLDPKVASSGLPNIIAESSRNAVAAMVGATVQVEGANCLVIRAVGKRPIGEAIRCLIKLLPLKDKAATTVDSYMRDAANSCYLLPAVVNPDHLDYQNRDLALGRWVLPVARAQDPLQSCIDNEGLNRVQAGIAAMQLNSAIPKSQPTPSVRRRPWEHAWLADTYEQLAAQFGQALYPLDNPSGSSAIFVPVQAGLPKVLVANDFMTKFQHSFPNLEYSFTAAPGQWGLKDGQKFPQLDAQFSYNNEKGQYYIKRVSLGLDEHVHEVLLPGSAVDVRFLRRTILRLKNPRSCKMLGGFVQAVLENLSSKEKLFAPDLTIDIPKWTVPGYARAHEPGTHRVEYLFTGARFRHSVWGSVMGNEVTITTKQSGKLSASGTTLSTYYGNPNQENLNSFVKSCFVIADTLTQAAASSEHLANIYKSRKEAKKQQSQVDTTFTLAEQAGAATVSSPAEQEPVTGSPDSSAYPSTRLTHQDMQDLSLSSFLSDEPVTDEVEISTFTRSDFEAPEQPEDDPIKAAA